MKVSFVIPCYRSEKTITSVVNEIIETMSDLSAYQHEIILVNDCSPDNTMKVIRRLAQSNSFITGINLARNFGQHAALMAGIKQSNGDIIVCLDDDGQTPADEVGKLLEKIENGYDAVYASYEHKQHSKFRNIGSYINSKMAEFMLEKPKNLNITSYFAVKRFVADEMLRYENCYPYIIGLLLRVTKNICNVNVAHRSRESGRSGYTLVKLFSLWMNGFTSFSVKPLRMATYLGSCSAIIGFLYMLYIIIKFFVKHSAPMGWSSTMALILLLGGMMLIVMGLIGEYTGRIYMCVNAAPQYVISEIVKCEAEKNEI